MGSDFVFNEPGAKAAFEAQQLSAVMDYSTSVPLGSLITAKFEHLQLYRNFITNTIVVVVNSEIIGSLSLHHGKEKG